VLGVDDTLGCDDADRAQGRLVQGAGAFHVVGLPAHDRPVVVEARIAGFQDAGGAEELGAAAARLTGQRGEDTCDTRGSARRLRIFGELPSAVKTRSRPRWK
jgi:hypothetical protein